MNTLRHFANRFAVILLAALSLGLCACQSSKVSDKDWNSRVGKFTYDEAVREMGPPENSANLSDGTHIAQWVHQAGSDGRMDRILYGDWIEDNLPDKRSSKRQPTKLLDLEFDNTGTLKAWRWVRR